jgi:hypothetical protein
MYSVSIEQIPYNYWRDEKIIAYAFYVCGFINTVDLMTYKVYDGSGLENNYDIIKYHNNLTTIIGLSNLKLIKKLMDDGYIIKAIFNNMHKTQIELVHINELLKQNNIFNHYPMFKYIGLHKL